jgi:hypothetical protein
VEPASCLAGTANSPATHQRIRRLPKRREQYSECLPGRTEIRDAPIVPSQWQADYTVAPTSSSDWGGKGGRCWIPPRSLGNARRSCRRSRGKSTARSIPRWVSLPLIRLTSSYGTSPTKLNLTSWAPSPDEKRFLFLVPETQGDVLLTRTELVGGIQEMRLAERARFEGTRLSRWSETTD